MTTSIIPSQTIRSERKPLFTAFYRRAVLKRLDRLAHGCLYLLDGGDLHHFGEHPDQTDLVTTIRVSDLRFWSQLARGGGNGAADAYIDDYWLVDDLTTLVRIFARNRHVLSSMEGGLAALAKPLHRVRHWLRANTRTGARKNIRAHYDIGNDLFALMLDPTMMYSSAFYARSDMILLEASITKLDRICCKLDIQPGEHVLEIGTGWGGFAIHAARNYGCSVTTTTISQEQYDLACQRIELAGLSDKITVLLQDYRDLDGSFDKLVSIEMIEAIGYRQYPTYFANCERLLKPDGIGLIQAITIADGEYERAKDEVDFIKQRIFPGSCIPSLTALQQAMTNSSRLRMVDVEDITTHYARTIAEWRENCEANQLEISQLGYDDKFKRLWNYYLCYCEGGFLERVIGDIQFVFAKDGWRSQTNQHISSVN